MPNTRCLKSGASHPSASETPSTEGEGQSPRTPRKTFEQVMNTQVQRCAVTLKHTSVTKEELLDYLSTFCHYARVGHEIHKEENRIEGQPDDHLHAHLQLKKVMRLSQVYNGLQNAYDSRMCGRPDVRQLKTALDATKWDNYCKKEGDYIDHGELCKAGPTPRGRDARDESST